MLLLLAYIVSPYDLVPEAVYGIPGYVDDLGACVIFIISVSSAFLQILTHQNKLEEKA